MRRLMRRLGAGQRHQARRGFGGNRRYRHTVGRVTPMLCATFCTAEASTMSARSIRLRGRLRSATSTHTWPSTMPIPNPLSGPRPQMRSWPNSIASLYDLYAFEH